MKRIYRIGRIGAMAAGLLCAAAFTAEAPSAMAQDQTQIPAPGTETALRGLLNDLQAGKPNFDRMEPVSAELVRQQLTAFQTWFRELGGLQSLTFKGNDPNGGAVFEAIYANGSMSWAIALNAKQKIEIYGIDKSETH